MRSDKHTSEISGNAYQRRSWMLAALISLAVNLVLAFGLATQKQTVQQTFIPPELDKPFLLKDGQYNNAYVEQVATWFLSMALNYTPASFKYQMITFSKHIDPELYGEMRKILRKELDDITRQNRSSTFFVQKVRIRGMNALVTGIRRISIGATPATEEQQHWLVKLTQRRDGLVTLADFKQVDAAAVKDFMKR